MPIKKLDDSEFWERDRELFGDPMGFGMSGLIFVARFDPGRYYEDPDFPEELGPVLAEAALELQKVWPKFGVDCLLEWMLVRLDGDHVEVTLHVQEDVGKKRHGTMKFRFLRSDLGYVVSPEFLSAVISENYLREVEEFLRSPMTLATEIDPKIVQVGDPDV